METKVKVKVVIVYPNSEYITHWQTDKNTMLNCQNVSTVKKMLYCSGFRTYVLETVRNFSKTSTRTSSLLYISAIAFFVSRRTVIWKLLCTNIRWPPTSHSSTNGIARISAYWNGMQKTPDWMSSLQAHFPFPSPTPHPLLFSLFSNSRANEPVRRLDRSWSWVIAVNWIRKSGGYQLFHQLWSWGKIILLGSHKLIRITNPIWINYLIRSDSNGD